MKYLLIILLILSLLMIGRIYAQQKTLDDLVEITDDIMTLKYGLTFTVLGNPITLPKGTKIIIQE